MKLFNSGNTPKSEEGALTAFRQITPGDMPGVPLLASASAFWFSANSSSGVPNWSHFEPGEHASTLPHILLCEIVEGRFFVRVAGEAVVKHVPVKLANQFLDAVGLPGMSGFIDALACAAGEGTPIASENAAGWIVEDERIGFQAVHLPFCSADTHVDRVLSVISFRAEPVIDL